MDADKLIQDLNCRFAAPLPEFYLHCFKEKEVNANYVHNANKASR